MDVTFIYENLAVGGGIFTPEAMQRVKDAGITHILDVQAEFDDTPLATPLGIKVCWCPAYDNFSEPSSLAFDRAAAFIEEHLVNGPKEVKMLIHCAGGVHRGPMFTLLACMLVRPDLASKKIVERIEDIRMIANFPSVYRSAVERYLEKRGKRT